MILAEHDHDRVVLLATRLRLTLVDDTRFEINVNFTEKPREILRFPQRLAPLVRFAGRFSDPEQCGVVIEHSNRKIRNFANFRSLHRRGRSGVDLPRS